MAGDMMKWVCSCGGSLATVGTTVGEQPLWANINRGRGPQGNTYHAALSI